MRTTMVVMVVPSLVWVCLMPVIRLLLINWLIIQALPIISQLPAICSTSRLKGLSWNSMPAVICTLANLVFLHLPMRLGRPNETRWLVYLNHVRRQPTICWNWLLIMTRPLLKYTIFLFYWDFLRKKISMKTLVLPVLILRITVWAWWDMLKVTIL